MGVKALQKYAMMRVLIVKRCASRAERIPYLSCMRSWRGEERDKCETRVGHAEDGEGDEPELEGTLLGCR